MKAVWLRPRISVDGKEVQLPYATGTSTAQLMVDFESYAREWKIGEQIDVNPFDCQAIAMSLSMLGQQLQAEFEGEMNAVIGISAPTQ